MEQQSYNEWLAQNPGKPINEYYQLVGAKPTIESQQVLSNGISADQVLPSSISIKITPMRLFLYTGVVMLSTIIWTILLFAIGYSFIEELMKHVFMRLGK